MKITMNKKATAPMFSIVIPTKNRPLLLKETMKSVLLQNFDDYELIVSDDSDDNESQEIVSGLKNNTHLKYIRPNHRMNMPSHFEWATKQASGKYVLLFPDRSILIQGALRQLSDLIKNHSDIQAITWPWLIFDEKRGIFCGNKLAKIQTGFRKSPEIISSFLKNPENLYNMPRNLNTCYSAEIAMQIRNKFGALFMSINPDFTFSFLILSQIDKVFYLGAPLFISQGLTASTGNASQFNSFLKSQNLSNPFSHVPFKIPLFMNTVFEDFLKIQKMVDKNLSPFKIDWAVYLYVCYKELFWRRRLFNKEEFYQLQEEFNKVLEKFDENTQNKVRQQMPRVKILAQLEFWIYKYKVDEYIRGVKRRIDFIRIKGLRRAYKNVLEAAGFNV